MKRRTFLLAGALVPGWRYAYAQTPGKVWLIGRLNPATAAQAGPYLAEFRRGLQELGYAEGRHFVLEERNADLWCRLCDWL